MTESYCTWATTPEATANGEFPNDCADSCSCRPAIRKPRGDSRHGMGNARRSCSPAHSISLRSPPSTTPLHGKGTRSPEPRTRHRRARSAEAERGRHRHRGERRDGDATASQTRPRSEGNRQEEGHERRRHGGGNRQHESRSRRDGATGTASRKKERGLPSGVAYDVERRRRRCDRHALQVTNDLYANQR